MAKYETDVQIPAVSGVQKPGADRYAVPQKVAEHVLSKLPGGTSVEASWAGSEKLSVTVEHGGDQLDEKASAARAALQDVLGPDSVIAPFKRVVEDGGA